MSFVHVPPGDVHGSSRKMSSSVGQRTGAGIISDNIIPCPLDMLSAFMRFPSGGCA